MNDTLFTLDFNTKKPQQFINITAMVTECVHNLGVVNGLLVVFCPHTTAGLTINVNTDPDVPRDIINTLDKIYPKHGDYRHFEGNSDAHLKSSAIGISETIIIKNGEPLLGKWQSIYLCEFDGPRNRKVYVKIMKEE
jgi:secondary thiamine-phosphate synthase enzyme